MLRIGEGECNEGVKKKTSKSAEKKDEHDAVSTAWLVVDTDWQDSVQILIHLIVNWIHIIVIVYRSCREYIYKVYFILEWIFLIK